MSKTVQREITDMEQLGHELIKPAANARSKMIVDLHCGHKPIEVTKRQYRTKVNLCSKCPKKSRGSGYLKIQETYAPPGWKVLPTENRGVNLKFSFVCPVDETHINQCIAKNFKGHCAFCSPKKKPNMSKQTDAALEKFLKVLETEKYKLYSDKDDYKTQHSKLTVQCPYNHAPYETSLVLFTREFKRCAECMVERRGGKFKSQAMLVKESVVNLGYDSKFAYNHNDLSIPFNVKCLGCKTRSHVTFKSLVEGKGCEKCTLPTENEKLLKETLEEMDLEKGDLDVSKNSISVDLGDYSCLVTIDPNVNIHPLYGYNICLSDSIEKIINEIKYCSDNNIPHLRLCSDQIPQLKELLDNFLDKAVENRKLIELPQDNMYDPLRSPP
jgi:hypothetical protein